MGGSHWTFYTRGMAKRMDLKTIGINLETKGLKKSWMQMDVSPSWSRFFGLIVFPKWDKHINIHLAGVEKVLTTMESPTIFTMILVYMFRALTKCISSEMYFEGYNILLQICFLEHHNHHNCVLRFILDWCNYFSSHKEREEKNQFFRRNFSVSTKSFYDHV